MREVIKIKNPLAKEAIDVALEIAREIEDEYWRGKALASIASILASKGRIDEALKMARGIEDKGVRGEALASIALILASTSMTDDARSIIDEALGMRKIRSIIDEALGVKKFRSIIDEALRKRESERNTPVMHSASIASALASMGKIDEARKITEEIKDDWWRSGALASIASALASMGKIDEATLSRAEETEQLKLKEEEKMPFMCSSCGREFYIPMKYVTAFHYLEVRCPYCGQTTHPDLRVRHRPEILCVNCGKRIVLSHEYIHVKNAPITCPSCRARMRVTILFGVLKEVRVEHQFTMVCPNCGAAMPSEARFCGRCGRELPKNCLLYTSPSPRDRG